MQRMSLPGSALQLICVGLVDQCQKSVSRFLCFPAHDELGTLGASLACPKQMPKNIILTCMADISNLSSPPHQESCDKTEFER